MVPHLTKLWDLVTNERVIERRCGMGFAKKTLVRYGVLLRLEGQKFQGDLAVQTGVGGEEHFTHAAFAELRGDFVM